ncbi:MAG TPA: hypothetical protein DER60_13375 [Syntrophomonas sp.]|jgi:uncharacterized protein YlxW (UPF0749 family)|nr:hypothetical protein [Syntrophomonas sp.]
MRSRNAQITIAIVSLILGILLAIQFKTQENINDTLMPGRVEELSQSLIEVTKQRDALAEEVQTLSDKLQKIRQVDEAMADLQDEVMKANMAAGKVAVSGPGVLLTLNDSNRTLQSGENPNYGIVHDYDLLTLVNELRASGAEAIAVNGERLTAISEIRCAGTLILVNWARIGPPYEIKAIGDPEMLTSGLNIRGGHLETLKYLGVQTNLQKADKLELPAYNGAMKFTHAVPVITTNEAE